MIRIFQIAFRNLMRYKRRTLLTSLLITLGLLMVILFSGLAGSFKGNDGGADYRFQPRPRCRFIKRGMSLPSIPCL